MSGYASEPGLDVSIAKVKVREALLLGVSTNSPARKHKGDSGDQFLGRVT